jgi:hypothetical protein
MSKARVIMFVVLVTLFVLAAGAPFMVGGVGG